MKGVVSLFERMGRDHALSTAELPAGPELSRMWSSYERHWRRFCGSRIDPQFHRLCHPARRTGGIAVRDQAPVIVVGTGPSLKAQLDELRRVRSAVHIFTSPRGAQILGEAGIDADLVLIEHQTPLDAHFTARDAAHRPSTALSRAAFVAADARTPAGLLTGIDLERLFIPDPLPTWGLWPATAVALAMNGGARMVGLLGIDLGSPAQPDASQTPLMEALTLLASEAEMPCVDLGDGVFKKHWLRGSVDTLPISGPRFALEPLLQRAPTHADRHWDAVNTFQRLAMVAAEARTAMQIAIRVRDGDASAGAVRRLQAAFEGLLAYGPNRAYRVELQDGLGLSFLPALWRQEPNVDLRERLWRPVLMAAHELTRQHETLGRRLGVAA
jgi:hypothetical protein